MRLPHSETCTNSRSNASSSAPTSPAAAGAHAALVGGERLDRARGESSPSRFCFANGSTVRQKSNAATMRRYR